MIKPDDGALVPTPGQTVGPFFHYALPFPGDRQLVPASAGASLRLHGYVFDGAGDPVPDALLEIRQAAPDGIVPAVAGSLDRAGAAFTGWGRAATDRSGRYWFDTLEPGPAAGQMLSFFAVTLFARGLLHRLFTRAYLPADEAALPEDALLGGLQPDRRSTLLARQDQERSLRFDIHLQGPQETVFLRFPRPS